MYAAFPVHAALENNSQNRNPVAIDPGMKGATFFEK